MFKWRAHYAFEVVHFQTVTHNVALLVVGGNSPMGEKYRGNLAVRVGEACVDASHSWIGDVGPWNYMS